MKPKSIVRFPLKSPSPAVASEVEKLAAALRKIAPEKRDELLAALILEHFGSNGLLTKVVAGWKT